GTHPPCARAGGTGLGEGRPGRRRVNARPRDPHTFNRIAFGKVSNVAGVTPSTIPSAWIGSGLAASTESVRHRYSMMFGFGRCSPRTALSSIVKASDLGPRITRTSRYPSLGQDRGDSR